MSSKNTSTSSSVLYPIVTTIGGAGRRGFIDGVFNESYLDTPMELLQYTEYDILIIDNKNNCLRNMNLLQQTITTIPTHSFLGPRSPVLIDNNTAIIICDSGHNKLRLLQFLSSSSSSSLASSSTSNKHHLPIAHQLMTNENKIIEDYTVAGTGRAGFHDGIANNATFNNPSGLCVINDGSILICDTNNHAIRRLSARPGKEGLYVTTIIGQKGQGFTDGNSNIASLNNPTSICMDDHGTIFICDTGNHAIRILHPPIDNDMGNTNGYILTTLTGIGIPGYLDHNISLYSLLREPGGIKYDNYTKNLLITDTGNNAIRCISSLSTNINNNNNANSNCNLYTLSSKGIIEPVPIGIPISVDRAIFMLDSIKISSTLAEQKPYRIVIISPVLYQSIANNSVFLSSLQSIGRNNGSTIPVDIITYADPIVIADIYRRYNNITTVAGAPPAVIETMIQHMSNNNRIITNPSANTNNLLNKDELNNVAPDALPAVNTIANKVTQYNYNTAQITALQNLKRYGDGPCLQSRFRRPIGIMLLEGGKGSALITDSSNHLIRLLISEDAIKQPPNILSPYLTPSLLSLGASTLSLLKAQAKPSIINTSSSVTSSSDTSKVTINNNNNSSNINRRTSVSSVSSGMRDFVANSNLSSSSANVAMNKKSDSSSAESKSSVLIKNPPILPPGKISDSGPSVSMVNSSTVVPTVSNTHNQHHHNTINSSLTSNHHHYSLATESSIRHLPGDIHEDQQLRMEIDQRFSPSKVAKHNEINLGSSSLSSSLSNSTMQHSIHNVNHDINNAYLINHKGTTTRQQNIQMSKFSNGIPLSTNNPTLLHNNTVALIDKQIARTVDPVGVGLLAAAALAVPTNISTEVEKLALDPHAALQASALLLTETNNSNNHNRSYQQQQRRKSVVPPPFIPVATTTVMKASVVPNSKEVSASQIIPSLIPQGSLSSRPIGWKFEDEVATDRKHGLLFTTDVVNSRDAIALEEHNAAGYVIKSLLLNDNKSHKHQTTVASRSLLNARYAKHTTSSARYYRENGQTVVRNAPAFVNVNRVVERTIHDLKAKATENLSHTNEANIPVQSSSTNLNNSIIDQEKNMSSDASMIIAAALSPSKQKKVISSSESYAKVLDFNDNIKLPSEQIVPSQSKVSITNALTNKPKRMNGK